ncbi:MAG TPA: DUF3298 domain-containing protein [Pyrinomonadaceae bacterium]|nr:DUF3298 domain-containing protein [Pyrinomonadaceae bacterium]
MRVRTCLIIACLVISLGCSKTSTSPPTALPPPGTATPSPELSHVAGGETPAPPTKYFKGSIGSSLDLQMKLVRTGDQLAGSYFYQKIGTRINLRGNVDKDGNLTLEEFDQAGKQTGLFKGLWTVNDGLINLAGNWSKPPGEKGSEKKIAFSVHEEPIAFTGDVEIVSKQNKESNKKLMYEIAAQYPQLTGGNNPNFEKFNQAARASVTRKVAGFKKDMQPEAEEEEPRPEGSMGSDLSVTYEVLLAQDDLVSVKFDVSSYFQGAAHPNSYSDVLNYDLKNGKQLKLSDLFKPGAKFLQTIATYCIADLKKQAQAKGLLAEEIEKGAAAKSDNYDSWTITRRGLGIYFDAYQVGPYAAGPQFVLVPYSTLKDLINPEGPIAQLGK